MERQFRKYQRVPFDAERCTRCGLCLSQCPVMQLPEAEAQREIESLIRCLDDPDSASPATQRVLRACTSCFACNVVCPEHCHPTNLFLDLWHRAYQRQGMPERARWFLPHSRPNFRTYVLDRMPQDEQEAVRSWASLEPAETLFYPGCNLVTTPYLTFSRIFSGLPIRGGLDYCCGEMYFRMGAYDLVEQTARKCAAYFKRLQARTVYLQCTAGLNMFTNILPQFGADFSGIQFVPFIKYLRKQLDSGAWPIVKRFDGKTITVQDSCHAKIYEPDFQEWPRKVLAMLGFQVVEAPCHGDTGLCCGIGSGFSHESAYHQGDMIAGQRACVRNLRATRPDYVAVYCSGCLEMMSVSRYVARLGSPVYHVLELVQEAIGETPLRRHRRVAFNFITGALRNQRGGRRRFAPPPVE